MLDNTKQHEGGLGHVRRVMSEAARRLDVQLPSLDMPASPTPRQPQPRPLRPPLVQVPTAHRIAIRDSRQAPMVAAPATRRRRFRKVRLLLRDHITPADLARAIVTTILLNAGTVMLAATVLRYTGSTSAIADRTIAWEVPLMLTANALLWILGLTVPSLIVIKFVADLSWLRIVYYFSMIWFLADLAPFL